MIDYDDSATDAEYNLGNGLGSDETIEALAPTVDPFITSTALAVRLTDRQRLYAKAYAESGGDWKFAAQFAGYADSTSREDIENGTFMQPYMVMLKREMSTAAAMNGSTLKSQMAEIVKRATEAGKFSAAVAGQTALMKAEGMFDRRKDDDPRDSEGNRIIIQKGNPVTEKFTEDLDKVLDELDGVNKPKARVLP